MASSAPELLVLASRCHTFGRPARVEALAVARGRITAVGRRRELLRLRGRGTRILDLSGATVTPGLTDCHTHFFYWALQRDLVIDVTGLPSLAATQARLHAGALRRRAGDWVLGSGFDQNRWNQPFPHARDLDLAVPDRPAIVRSRDGHSAWLNTAALEKLNITAATVDPRGGRIFRDEHGRPTGIVQETALELVPDALRELAQRTDAAALRVIDRALHRAYRAAHACGITGVHVMDDGPSLAHLQRHHSARRLGVRVVHTFQLAELDAAARLGLRSGMGDDWLRLGGIKIYVDGALGSQTAYMFAPYPGRGDYAGVPNIAGDDLRAAVRRCAAHGWAAWVHAIGDRAVHEVVSALAGERRARHTSAGPGSATRPGDSVPHRIEHVQCARPADIRRMARTGIVASVQPCHILGDIITADRHWPRARRHAYPLRTLADAGVALAAGSDVPIESIDPRRSLHGAVVRADEDGCPDGGWFPAQRLTVAQTLRAFTVGAAVAAGRAAPWGTLAPGAPADLTIWDSDPFAARPEELLTIGILGCVIDGQVVSSEL